MKVLTVSPLKALCLAIFLCFSYTSVQAASTVVDVTVNFLGKDYTKRIDYSDPTSVTSAHASLIAQIKDNSPLLADKIVEDEVNRVLRGQANKLASSSDYLSSTNVLLDGVSFSVVFNFQNVDEVNKLAVALSDLGLDTVAIKLVLEIGSVPTKITSSTAGRVTHLRDMEALSIFENIGTGADTVDAYIDTINEQQAEDTSRS